MEIAVIVPTARSTENFLRSWDSLFITHKMKYVEVKDGDNPTVNDKTVKQVMGDYGDLIYNKSDVVRNLGFVYAKKEYDPDIYITLDDDVEPIGDTIQDHLNALNMRFPKHWMSTASDYVRGIPYNIRLEMECVVSHGVWQGEKDWDAPTQLVKGNPDATFYRGGIPKGVLFPLCGMNVAFKSKALPYMYFAPMGHKVDIDRFGDIWMGIELKKVCDEKDWAVASGYAQVLHNKASNVFDNLRKEAKGIKLNECYGKGGIPYFNIYKEKRRRWIEFISKL